MRPYNPLARLFSTLDRVETALADSRRREIFMATALGHLTTEVAAVKTIAQSTATLLAGLSKQLHDNAADPAAIEALANDLDASVKTISDAIVANTPVAPSGLGAGPSPSTAPAPEPAPPAAEPSAPVLP